MYITKEIFIAGLYLLGATKSNYIPTIFSIKKPNRIINIRISNNLAIYNNRLYSKSQFMDLLIKIIQDYNEY